MILCQKGFKSDYCYDINNKQIYIDDFIKRYPTKESRPQIYCRHGHELQLNNGETRTRYFKHKNSSDVVQFDIETTELQVSNNDQVKQTTVDYPEVILYFKLDPKKECHHQIINEIKGALNDNILISDSYKWIVGITDLSRNKRWDIFQYYVQWYKLGVKTPDDIMVDPMLLEDIFKGKKVGFRFIDNLALANSWWTRFDFTRLKALVEYLLEEEEAKQRGNLYSFVTPSKHICFGSLCRSYDKLLDDTKLDKLLDQLIDDNTLKRLQIQNESAIALTKIYDIEYNIAKEIKNMNRQNELNLQYNICDKDLSQEQTRAVIGCIKNKISILNGGPGTGKTSKVLKEICFILAKTNRLEVLVLAPTHAAKNRALEELNICGNIQFNTLQMYIHSTKLSQQNFNYIIIDEMSMVDSWHMNRLLNDIKKNKSCLILVGDFNQLPPIGIGFPFKDIITSKTVPIFCLTYNYRSKKSDIPIFLNKIIQPYSTMIKQQSSKKAYNYEQNFIFHKHFKNVHPFFDDNNIMNHVETLLINLKEQRYILFDGVNHKDKKTLQILCPTNRTITESGIVSIVRKIFYGIDSEQLYCNEDVIILNQNTPFFKNGDYAKIINIYENHENNTEYALQLKSLDLDNISDIEEIKNSTGGHKTDHNGYLLYKVEDNIYALDLDNKRIILTKNFFSPSFAITVHKSQGLGFEQVITIYEGGFVNKNLNYTAFSRAKEDIYLFGENSVYKNPNAPDRRTLLDLFLTDSI